MVYWMENAINLISGSVIRVQHEQKAVTILNDLFRKQFYFQFMVVP